MNSCQEDNANQGSNGEQLKRLVHLIEERWNWVWFQQQVQSLSFFPVWKILDDLSIGIWLFAIWWRKNFCNDGPMSSWKKIECIMVHSRECKKIQFWTFMTAFNTNPFVGYSLVHHLYIHLILPLGGHLEAEHSYRCLRVNYRRENIL